MTLRRRTPALALLMLVIAYPTAAAAQSTLAYNALFTPYVGVTAGDDVEGGGLTAGASLGVVQSDGWGAEVDFGYVNGIDGRNVENSEVVSLMGSLLYIWPRSGVQPFGVAGMGMLRLNAVRGGDGGLTTRTDFGLMFGGGVHVPITELVGVRGDVRYLRFLDDRPDVPAANGVFGTWRISGGVTINWPIEP